MVHDPASQQEQFSHYCIVYPIAVRVDRDTVTLFRLADNHRVNPQPIHHLPTYPPISWIDFADLFVGRRNREIERPLLRKPTLGILLSPR